MIVKEHFPFYSRGVKTWVQFLVSDFRTDDVSDEIRHLRGIFRSQIKWNWQIHQP